MNPILQRKYDELNEYEKFECWYLVKQPTAFDNICYLVSFLEEYKNDNEGKNLQDFISEKIAKLSELKPNVEISNNYRALRVAAFFGLIIMTSSKYEEAIITDSFRQIKERCNGEFENTDSYIDIIERQIEKMFISSEVDEQFEGVRQEFRLYPVMLLYKVLLEIGRATGKYQIATDEYRYFVATTKVFENFLETLILIKLYRDEDNITNSFDVFREKFDNRLIQALKQLPALEITRDTITIKDDKINEVAKKVFLFEENPNIFATDNYLNFLGSTKSLFDLEDFADTDQDSFENSLQDGISETNRVKSGTNILLYGVPGSGKSYTIKNEYCKDESKIERVVFHPDYMNTDFIGQILPVVKADKSISYDFVPGPFTKIVKKAYEDPSNNYYLVIEEINRGNAPAIFGDVFQLLDRDEDGRSTYSITNQNIAEVVFNDPNKMVFIPSNLTILATMNTADQNVFTLDTAFQRRWLMRMIKNDVEKADHSNIVILDTNVNWATFAETINKQIIDSNSATMSSEDKRLGAYFITKDVLESDSNKMSDENFHSLFAEKVIKYLWDDAFKFGRDKLFNPVYKSLEDVIEDFSSKKGISRFDIFETSIRDLLKEKSKIILEEPSEEPEENTNTISDGE